MSFTHITHVCGIQLRACGGSAAYDVLRLLQMEAAGVKSFIQLSDVSLQRASVTCRGTPKLILVQEQQEVALNCTVEVCCRSQA